MLELLAKERPDATQKRCYDCTHLRGAVSLWCTNKDAVKRRGTSIPGTDRCPSWAPMRMWEDLSMAERAQHLALGPLSPFLR